MRNCRSCVWPRQNPETPSWRPHCGKSASDPTQPHGHLPCQAGSFRPLRSRCFICRGGRAEDVLLGLWPGGRGSELSPPHLCSFPPGPRAPLCCLHTGGGFIAPCVCILLRGCWWTGAVCPEKSCFFSSSSFFLVMLPISLSSENLSSIYPSNLYLYFSMYLSISHLSIYQLSSYHQSFYLPISPSTTNKNGANENTMDAT